MKMKTFLSVALVIFSSRSAIAQTPGVSDIGVGYFNDHQFATFGTLSGTTLTGDLAGNAFTINFSTSTHTVLRTIAGYGPNVPANSGTFSAAAAEVNYSVVPATSTVTFTTALQPLDQLHAIDVENGESVTFEFLDASSNPVTIAGNVKVVSLSTISPTASLNYPSSTMVGVNTSPNRITTTNSDQGFSFVMLTNVVKTIRFIQTNPSTGGSWDFTFSKGAPDRGDAPASYGNATHLSLAARLKLGANGGDAESAVFSGTTASGDDAVSGSTIIDDDDAIATVPTVANSGAHAQVIPTYSVTATVTNSTGASANVMAWTDWNGNGTFDASEAATAAAVPTGSTNASRTFTWTNATLDGSGGRTGTFLRLRTTTNTLTSSNATGFATDGEVEDYVVPFAVTLPITLKAFTVTAVDSRYALLEWQTGTEQHNTGFDIEHSAQGVQWQKIGFIPTMATQGNSSATLSYSFRHDDPLPGTNYYRLKQIDLDGKTTYSPVRIVNISGDASGITVTPNPATDAVFIRGVHDGDLITLYNSAGQTVGTKRANASWVRFDTGRFSAGVYTIQVRRKAGGVESFTMLKK